MKLKAVEMQGFKSFPDRTKLTFDDGITVIVGPNGSGKSNISDAIKWVFGEQSVKSLRGAKMEDVIFGGSISRKPTGFAWVSLFIDNTDRSIDIDSDEVVITRRLYRSGESEYRINNNPVRLRDINEMFMDTGLGRDGYSVIEQGKIAEIVSAKSTQRREIFEEAAGISRFRYRKTEAERKLQQAEDNLVRLRDIMQELEDRVGPLKAQSEKAKQYVVLAGEKKSLEISLWLEQLTKLGRQLAELEDKTLLAANDRTTAQRRLDEIERELEEIQHKTQDANLYIEHKRERIKEFEDAISNAKVEAAVKQNTIDHNNDTIAELEKELERSELSAGELEEKLTALREDYQNRLDEAQKTREALEGGQKALEAQRQEEHRLAELSAETAGTLAEETVTRLEALRGQAKDKDENLSRLREELAGHKAFAEELQERLQSLQNSKNGYLYKLKSRSDKQAEAESRQRNSEKLAGEKLQRAQVLSDLEKNYESFNNSVKFVMKQAGAGALRGIVGPVSSLIKTENRYSTAVEIALGAAAYFLTLSRLLLQIFEGILRAIRQILHTLLQPVRFGAKKFSVFLKNLFARCKKWGTIIGKIPGDRTDSERGQAKHETRQVFPSGEAGYPDSGRVRDGDARVSAQADHREKRAGGNSQQLHRRDAAGKQPDSGLHRRAGHRRGRRGSRAR